MGWEEERQTRETRSIPRNLKPRTPKEGVRSGDQKKTGGKQCKGFDAAIGKEVADGSRRVGGERRRPGKRKLEYERRIETRLWEGEKKDIWERHR